MRSCFPIGCRGLFLRLKRAKVKTFAVPRDPCLPAAAPCESSSQGRLGPTRNACGWVVMPRAAFRFLELL
jgi:hypothetical protein